MSILAICSWCKKPEFCRQIDGKFFCDMCADEYKLLTEEYEDDEDFEDGEV